MLQAFLSVAPAFEINIDCRARVFPARSGGISAPVSQIVGLHEDVKRFQNGSMNITVKNVPESVYRVIKREAKNQRRSLNAQIIEALETEAAEVERRRNSPLPAFLPLVERTLWRRKSVMRAAPQC